MNALYAILLLLYKSVRPTLTLVAILFAAAQLLLSRNMGAIESHGQMLEMASSAQTTDNGLRWALSELAPCQPWKGFDYRPAIAFESEDDALFASSDGYNDRWEREYRGRWEFCRFKGRDLSGLAIGDFGYTQFMYCPASRKEDFMALLGWPEDRPAGVEIERSDFSCVKFADASFPRLSARSARFVATDFRNALLAQSTWLNSDLRNAVFDKARLQGARFEGEDLRLNGASFDWAVLRDARFTNASLDGVSLRNADVSGADLSKTTGLTREALLQACAEFARAPTLPRGLEGATLPPCPDRTKGTEDANRVARRG